MMAAKVLSVSNKLWAWYTEACGREWEQERVIEAKEQPFLQQPMDPQRTPASSGSSPPGIAIPQPSSLKDAVP